MFVKCIFVFITIILSVVADTKDEHTSAVPEASTITTNTTTVAKDEHTSAVTESSTTSTTVTTTNTTSETAKIVNAGTTEIPTAPTDKPKGDPTVAGSTENVNVSGSIENEVLSKEHENASTIAPGGHDKVKISSKPNDNKKGGVSVFMVIVFVLISAILYVLGMWAFYNVRELWRKTTRSQQDWDIRYRLIDHETSI